MPILILSERLLLLLESGTGDDAGGAIWFFPMGSRVCLTGSHVQSRRVTIQNGIYNHYGMNVSPRRCCQRTYVEEWPQGGRDKRFTK